MNRYGTITLYVFLKMSKKKKREEILDAAYNRYMFDDGLLEWFVKEEKNLNQLQKPIKNLESLDHFDCVCSLNS